MLQPEMAQLYAAYGATQIAGVGMPTDMTGMGIPTNMANGQQQYENPAMAELQQYDDQTEAELERWVEAKRAKDYATADHLRMLLRAQGVDPDTARPSDRNKGGMMPQQPVMEYSEFRSAGMMSGMMPQQLASTMPAQSIQYDAATEAKLDQWILSKRNKDFATADAIRTELRGQGIDPDIVRPSDKDVAAQSMMMNPVQAVGMQQAMPYGMQQQAVGMQQAMPYGMQQQAVGMQQQAMLYDAETEAKLDWWVAAKRDKDFQTADAIRSELRAKGIDPDIVRPSNPAAPGLGHGLTNVMNSAMGHVAMYDADTEAKLDRWVGAKRDRDFVVADHIRGELRALGIDPDIARPSDKDLQAQSMLTSAMPMQHGSAMPMHYGSAAQATTYDQQTEALLDQWVEAKRCRRFAEADVIRSDLRAAGCDPDIARPSDKDLKANAMLHAANKVATGTRMTYDYETESQLDRWVTAKRNKDYATADAIRNELRERGVDPDTARPADKGNAPSQVMITHHGFMAPQLMQQPMPQFIPQHLKRFDEETEGQLDRWVTAKRDRDFNTADAIRNALRQQGIDPDTERPSDRGGNRSMGSSDPVNSQPLIYPGVGLQSSPSMLPPMKTFDPHTEAMIGQWSTAKRMKDFATADAIRNELRNRGVEADDLMARHPMGSPMAANQGVSPAAFQQPQNHGADINAELDRWVDLKRQKDYASADKLRQDLRARGVDPDVERPNDRNGPKRARFG